MRWPYVLKRSFRFNDWSVSLHSVEYQNILLTFVKSVCTFTIIHFITAFMFNKLLSLSLSLSLSDVQTELLSMTPQYH